MPAPPVEARPAATVMLIRDQGRGVEVLMVHRPDRGFFGGLAVFPGGAVEAVDRSRPRAVAHHDGPQSVYRTAALRELAEETGLALTRRGVVPAPPARGEALLASLEAEGKILDPDALLLVSRWVTPEDAPSRFDTRFFLAGVGETPEIRIDADELVGHSWLRPEAALDMERSGRLRMFLPTIAHLRWLSAFTTLDEALADASGADQRSLIRPVRRADGSLVPVRLPEPG